MACCAQGGHSYVACLSLALSLARACRLDLPGQVFFIWQQHLSLYFFLYVGRDTLITLRGHDASGKGSLTYRVR